ncbi:MAG: SdrD B-like domain-containing protein [Anaerolineae bacterium]|nr:SdrD B-like domain-containing protein [Anaerolineae bacterium]
MSIGNVVWADNGLGGGTGSNGVQDGGEVGIPNVAVTLYLDDGDGVFEPTTGDTVLATDVTDANGFYLFDGLVPNTYFVWVDDTNFLGGGALANF